MSDIDIRAMAEETLSLAAHESKRCDPKYTVTEDKFGKLCASINRLAAVAEAAQKDSQRLDWLERENSILMRSMDSQGETIWFVSEDFALHGKTLRAAIDAAASIATQAGKGME